MRRGQLSGFPTPKAPPRGNRQSRRAVRGENSQGVGSDKVPFSPHGGSSFDTAHSSLVTLRSVFSIGSFLLVVIRDIAGVSRTGRGLHSLCDVVGVAGWRLGRGEEAHGNGNGVEIGYRRWPWGWFKGSRNAVIYLYIYRYINNLKGAAHPEHNRNLRCGRIETLEQHEEARSAAQACILCTKFAAAVCRPRPGTGSPSSRGLPVAELRRNESGTALANNCCTCIELVPTTQAKNAAGWEAARYDWACFEASPVNPTPVRMLYGGPHFNKSILSDNQLNQII